MNVPLALLSLAALAFTTHAGPEEPIQVFLLVGQSNMEGKGALSHLEKAVSEQARDEERARFGHLKEGGEWSVREDVWISYRRSADDLQKGGLSVGYGGTDQQIGPELGFGTVIGNGTEQRVLLIKCAWGGASLREDFLPPGSGGPGGHYQRMLDEVHETLEKLHEWFPAEENTPHEFAGLVWFQGWNDSIGNGNPDYAEQLSQFIRDVRRDLNAPKMPVVIGELGQAGAHPTNPKVLAFRAQQRAVAEADEFKANVRYVETGKFVDPLLLEQFELWRDCQRKASQLETDSAKEEAWAPWKAIEEQYSARASDRPYHYFGSGPIFYAMGEAFGQAMLELR